MSSDISLLCESWKSAGEALGFRVITPYHATTSDGKKVSCVAYLPDFGSVNGMVVGAIFGPKFETDIDVKQIANEEDKYWSFINAKVYEEYDPSVFKEALEDWGFWGNEAWRPTWMQAVE